MRKFRSDKRRLPNCRNLRFKLGGPEGIQTPDPLVANHLNRLNLSCQSQRQTKGWQEVTGKSRTNCCTILCTNSGAILSHFLRLLSHFYNSGDWHGRSASLCLVRCCAEQWKRRLNHTNNPSNYTAARNAGRRSSRGVVQRSASGAKRRTVPAFFRLLACLTSRSLWGMFPPLYVGRTCNRTIFLPFCALPYPAPVEDSSCLFGQFTGTTAQRKSRRRTGQLGTPTNRLCAACNLSCHWGESICREGTDKLLNWDYYDERNSL